MRLSKMEKLTYAGSPFFFGIVLIACGIFVSKAAPEMVHGTVLICSGLICMSFYCVCALLVKMIEKA